MTNEERENMVVHYKMHPTPEEREKVIIEYAKEVKIISNQIYAKYQSSIFEKEDFENYGIIGLIDALNKYDINKDIKFTTYASIRIRGEILDYIRKMDISRTLRQKQRQYHELEEKAIIKYGTYHPNRNQIIEVAKEDGITYNKFLLLEKSLVYNVEISLDEYLESDDKIEECLATNENNGEEIVLKKDMQNIFSRALSILTEKERKVILFIYYEDLGCKEVSKVLGVTESRVSQIHTNALQKLREYLAEQEQIGTPIKQMTEYEIEKYIQNGGKNWNKILQNPNILKYYKIPIYLNHL